jgi:hypothetical protein
MALYDAVAFVAVSAGTGNFVVSTAVSGFRTPAVVANNTPVSYRAESASLLEWEFGSGTWNNSTSTLVRTAVANNHLGTTANVNFTLAPTVFLTALSTDLAVKNDINIYTANNTFGATFKANGIVDVASANVLSQTLTYAATQTWDASLGQIATLTLTANVTTFSAPTNLKVGTYILHVLQDATGSRQILAWNSVFKWPAASAPILTTTASSRDIISFVCDGTNLYGSFLPDVR